MQANTGRINLTSVTCQNGCFPVTYEAFIADTISNGDRKHVTEPTPHPSPYRPFFLFFVVVCLFKIGHSTLLMKLLQQIKTWLHVSQYRVNYWNLSILSDFFGLLCHKQSDELRTSTSACYGWFKTHKRLTVFFFLLLFVLFFDRTMQSNMQIFEVDLLLKQTNIQVLGWLGREMC